MTDPLDYTTSPATRPKPLGPAGIIAWVIIVLVAGFLVLANKWPELRGRAPVPKTSPMQMGLVGKYAVGVSRLRQDYGPQMLPQADATADTPADKIDVAILAGELAGKDEALKRLDALLPRTDEVSTTTATTLSSILAEGTKTAESFPQLPTTKANKLSTEPTTIAGDDEAAPPTEAQVGLLRRLYRDGPDSVSPTDRQFLLARHDFFGRLALAYGKPDTDPQRAAVLHEAVFAASVFLVFLGTVALLGLVGLALLILVIVFYFTGMLKTRFRPQPLLKPVFVEIFAAYLLLFVGASLLVAKFGGESLGVGAYWLITPIVPLAMGWGVIRGLTWREVLDGLGWFRGRGFWLEIPLGVVGYITGLPIIALGITISLVLMRYTHAVASHPIQNSFSTTPAWQLYAIAAVWAPVVEETFFRGALFNHMRRRWSWLISAPLVAFIFAAIHPQGLTFIPALGSIAIVLAGIREWRGTIISSITAHSLNNATVITLMLLTK